MNPTALQILAHNTLQSVSGIDSDGVVILDATIIEAGHCKPFIAVVLAAYYDRLTCQLARKDQPLDEVIRVHSAKLAYTWPDISQQLNSAAYGRFERVFPIIDYNHPCWIADNPYRLHAFVRYCVRCGDRPYYPGALEEYGQVDTEYIRLSILDGITAAGPIQDPPLLSPELFTQRNLTNNFDWRA